MLASLVCVSCISEMFQADYISPDDKNAIKLSFVCDDIQHYEVGTRAAVDKNSDETKINSLYIFFFNSNGAALPLSNSAPIGDIFRSEGGSATYIKLTGGETIQMLVPEYFGTGANRAKIYAVANLDGFDPTAITTEATLNNYKYVPSGNLEVTKVPDTGMPMFGSVSSVNLTTNGLQQTIRLKALMARVDFTIGINATNPDPTNTYPRMRIEKWTLGNVPNGVLLGNTGNTTFDNVIKKSNVIIQKLVEIQQSGRSHSETFYIFENRQPAAKTLEEALGFAPDSNLEEEAERFKPLRANANASYINLEGVYYDASRAQLASVLTFYLGANNRDNFQVTRNCHYNNVVTITGLVSNSVDYDKNQVLYDARVYVEGTEATPYFLSVLREHDQDAHFGVTPIDFYFYDLESVTDYKLKVEIVDPSNTRWIRMEKIDAVHMETGSVPTENNYKQYINAGYPWKAGHGKRKYFVTDMLSNSNYGLVSSCEVTNHRDRVYLYIDENISTSTRTAQVRFTYQIKTVDNPNWHDSPVAEVRTIDIVQRGLLEVPVHEDPSDPNSDIDHYIYVEYIEEYLDNYDPLDTYNSTMVYAGLPWGLNGTSIGNDYTNVYYNGSEATNTIINASGHTSLTLNQKPRSAAEYCYNKNKRNSSGRVTATLTSSGWFLPGIRQLENIMTQYQNLFPSLRTEFYWSSAVGKRRTGFIIYSYPEDTGYARATRYDYNDQVSNEDYIQSDWDDEYSGSNGIGGKVPRTTELRIRAAYYPPNGRRLQ